MFDDDARYRAVHSRDARFDGVFYTAVTTTGIYCRPSCPATTPKRANVRFMRTAAEAQAAGFRACRRCRPDTTPGSAEWNVRADLVGRAMRLVADGVVDRDGVAGLAARLGYSERQIHRALVAEVGAGPLRLARTQRAHAARTLIETSDLPVTDVAFMAGFASIRQFNDTMREVYAMTPTELRTRTSARRAMSGSAREPAGRGHSTRRGTAPARPAAPDRGDHPAASIPVSGVIDLRLAYRRPADLRGVLDFLALRAVPGVEEVDGDTYRRSVVLPHGPAVVELTPAEGWVDARLRLTDPRDLVAAVSRCRRLFDLDADPMAVDDVLGSDAVLRPLVAAAPGRRVPGVADPEELAVRAVLGQQVSVAAARTIAGRLTAAHGKPLDTPVGTVTHTFPSSDALAAIDPSTLPMPNARRRTVHELTARLADGEIVLDLGADREEVQRDLLAVPGVGPWTANYIRMRGLGDPDVFLPTDLGVRHGLTRLGLDGDPREAALLAECWRPWRSYALLHIWTTEPEPVESVS